LELQKGWRKPDSKADRKARENYIKSKYMWKGFLEYNESDGKTERERIENFSRALYDAAKRCDALDMSKALAFGADVDWVNSEDGSETPLQVCVLNKKTGDGKDWRAIECAELLLQHGAKMEVGEQEATTHILDVAEEQGAEKEMFDHLWKKTPETEKKDRLGLFLYEAAKNSDMNGLAEALAQGASVGWKNPKDGGKSALHIGVLGKKPEDESKWTAIECVELLLGRGGDLELLDNDGHSVVDCAVVGGAELEMIEYLNDRPK